MTAQPRDLALVDDASRMLAEASTIDEIKRVGNIAEAARIYAQKARLGLAAQNSAAGIRLEAEAKAGDLLARMKSDGERDAGYGDRRSESQAATPKLATLGVGKDESARYQSVARVAPERRAAYVAEATEKGDEVTRAGLLRATGDKTAPLMTSESDEWYTPEAVLHGVLRAFPVIDLDPCAEQGDIKNVPATTHYTVADDGLEYGWRGRVFANPPYSAVGAFAEKVAMEQANITEAIVLVPARTETRWWRVIPASVVCFFDGRLRFRNGATGQEGPATFPSAALYVGDEPERFVQAFTELGLVYRRVQP